MSNKDRSQDPPSIKEQFGEGIRKVVVGPFDLVYTHYPARNLGRIEALVYGRGAK